MYIANFCSYRLILVLFCLNWLSTSAAANTSLWEISKGNHKLFLGGTIHLMGNDDYPLPTAYEKAYSQADILVLETDLDATQQPEFQSMLMQTMRYNNGETLEDKLEPEVFTALAGYLSGHGIPITRMQNFKPGMVALTITVMEMQRLGLAGTGVDAFFNDKAFQDHKPRLYLETPEQQIQFLAEMGDGKENELIRHTLNDLEQLLTLLIPMKQAWRSGDTKALESIALTPWKNEFPDTYRSLLLSRNRAWYPQIRKMLKTEPVELVLVGALHLVGKDGILHRLKRKGYKVTPLSYTDFIQTP